MPQNANPLKQFFRQPSIYLSLPSHGQHWPKNSLEPTENNELPVFPMTAIDEITYRTPDALFNGQAVVNVIQSCVPNIKNAWDTPGSDLNAILISIRIASYGHNMELATKCPSCQTESDFTMDLRLLLDRLATPDYTKPLKYSDLEITLCPISYKHQNETNLKQYEQQRAIQQIQVDTTLSDEEKIEKLNIALKTITELTIEALKYSITSIRTPNTLVTDPVFIHEFLVNCDRKIYQEIRDHIIKLRTTNDLQPFDLKCPSCDHEWQQTITLDEAAFFGVAS